MGVTKHVVIIGGGVAGLTAAHELNKLNLLYKSKFGGEEPFRITLIEKDKDYLGGKARSINHLLNEPGFEKKFPFIPAEHGFRFMPGFYRNLDAVLKEIGHNGQPAKEHSVLDNLIKTECYVLTVNKKVAKPGDLNTSVDNERVPAEVPIKTEKFNFFGSMLFFLKQGGAAARNVRREGKMFVMRKLLGFILSSADRRMNEFERISWSRFIRVDRTDRFGEDYKYLLADGLTRSLAAAKAGKTSSRTGGSVFLKMVFESISPFGTASRVLGGPTNETWLKNWEKELTKDSRVVIKRNAELHHLENFSDHLTRFVVYEDNKKQYYSNYQPQPGDITFDYVLLATPLEITADILYRNDFYKKETLSNAQSIIQVDTALKGIITMKDSVEWMSGIIVYLKSEEEINRLAERRPEKPDEKFSFPRGHLNLMDSPWAITGILQSSFWEEEYALTNFGDGKIGSVFSCIMSNWETPHTKRAATKGDKRAAWEMTRDEVKMLAWEQMQSAWILKGDKGSWAGLTDEMTYSIDPTDKFGFIYLDDAIQQRPDADIIKDIEEYHKRLMNMPGNFSDFSSAYSWYREVRNKDVRTDKLIQVKILENSMPLLVNSVNTYPLRPDSYTQIDNLFLAGDYIRTEVDLATMEGACEAGKRAVNSIIYRFNKDNDQQFKIKNIPILLYKNRMVSFMIFLLFLGFALFSPLAFTCIRAWVHNPNNIQIIQRLPFSWSDIVGPCIHAAVLLTLFIIFIRSKHSRLFLWPTLGGVVLFGTLAFWIPCIVAGVYLGLMLLLGALYLFVLAYRVYDKKRMRKGLPFSLFQLNKNSVDIR